MSDVQQQPLSPQPQQQQGTAIDPSKVIAKLRNTVADQAVQIAMFESYIEMLQEQLQEVNNVGSE